MAFTQVNLNNKPNSSLQIGDAAFVSNVINADAFLIEDPVYAGIIVSINNNGVVVEGPYNIILQGQFFSFAKNITVNESSLKGYYANVTLKNESNKFAELFTISSDIAASSK